MSKTFSSRPTHTSSRGRGASNVGVSVSGTGVRQTDSQILGGTRRGRGTESHGTSRGAARGGRMNPLNPQNFGGSQHDSRRGRMSSEPIGAVARRGVGRGTSPSRRMNQPGYGQGDMQPKPDESESLDQRGEYVGGFTMFAPNEKRRQKIQQMAEKETRAYEQFKQENSGRKFKYVGTVGGGELSENQVRNRQAQEVRAQKFNRLARQTEMREEKRRADDREFDVKRAEQRLKAEQNQLRAENRTAPADEVRRKREAFLRQFESSNSGTNESTSQSPPVSQAVRTGRSPQTRNPPPSSTVKTEPRTQPSQQRTGQRTGSLSQNEQVPKQEVTTTTKQEFEAAQGYDEDFNHADGDLDFLSGMFPNLDTDYLWDLLSQMGSVDAVMQLLNGD